MIVNRTLFINPVEPEFLAFRISSGIETKVDFHFKQQTGAPHNEDLVAQLQMTGRSTDRTEYFSCPAIDVVNGKARVTLPADMNYDPNGWRLRLTGTVDQEPRVIAYGVATAVAGAGPQVEPQDIIDSVDLAFERDEEVNLNVTLWADNSKSAPYDLTAMGTSVNAYIFSAQGGSVIQTFAVTVISSHQVNLYLTPQQVNGLPDQCWWSLTAATGAGLTTLCEGDVTVTGVVVPPFSDVIADYEYIKQAALVIPTAGQLIHSDNALDLVRLHIFDFDGTDRSATLARLVVGDQIIVGVTTWSITSISKPGPDWYEAHIDPSTQASVTGEQPVTFHRP